MMDLMDETLPTVEDLIHQILQDLPSHEVGDYVPTDWLVDTLLDLANESKTRQIQYK